MSVDTRAYAFSDVWLRAAGWNNEIDKEKLAQLVQDLAEDFVMELEEDATKEEDPDADR